MVVLIHGHPRRPLPVGVAVMHQKHRLIPRHPNVQYIRWGVPREDDDEREMSYLANSVYRFGDIKRDPVIGYEVVVASRVSALEWWHKHGLAFIFSSAWLHIDDLEVE